MKKFVTYVTVMALVLAFMPTVTFAGASPAASSTKPAAPAALKGAPSGKTAIKLTWSKSTGAAGYEIYRADGTKYKKIKTTSGKTYVNKKLKANKTYKYKVRAYKKSGSKKVYSKFSYGIKVRTTPDSAGKQTRNVKTIKLSKKTAVLKKGKTLSLKTKLSPSKKILSSSVTWTSSDKSVASVSKSGLVSGKKAGTCTVKARSHNGLTASCKITVISDLSMSEDVYNMTKYLAKSEDYAFDVGYTLAYDKDLADDKTGFRTAGSDAEHRAAAYLEKEFKKIGLTSVEQVPVTVDKWQFNGAYLNLTYQDQNDNKQEVRIDDMISYASDGTVQLGGDWSNKEIVDVGMGFKDDYDKLDQPVTDKIVLAGVDQWNEVWIDGPYMEAAKQGAAAIITYPLGGYGQKNDDTNNVQDLCAPNKHIPCTGISKNNAKKIQDAIKAGGSSLSANLYVDNYVGDEDGTSYNVVGKIKGKDTNAQQIVIAAHYDKYFYGFQDDCIAVGLVTAIAKAMVDSGYKPQHDIVFVAHGAEEWGEFDTSTDWAIGSWEMITEARSDWQGRTLALLNYELPAIDHGAKNGIMRASYEMGYIGKKFLKSDLLQNVKAFYPNGVKVVNDDEMTQTDAIAYQFSGVPAVMPRQDDRTKWTQEHYHTQFDDVDTYSAALLEYDIACYSALAMYIDKTPALELDFEARCGELEAAMDENTERLAGAEAAAGYKTALAELKAASKAHLSKIQDLNKRYEAACKKGSSQSALEQFRTEGKALNETSLKLFRFAQDSFIGLAGYGDTEVFHKGLQNNIELLDETITALGDGQVTEDDMWILAGLYDWYEYYAYLFSPEVCEDSNHVLMNTKVEDNWSTGKMTTALKSYPTTQKMCALFYADKTASADYAEVISEYEGYKNTLLAEFNQYIESETKAMEEMKGMMQ